MKFVKLCGEPDYWRLNEERMRLYNYQNNSFVIDENSDKWMLSTIVEAEDWRDLYLKTGYCAFYAHDYFTMVQVETLRKWTEAWNVHLFDNEKWA